MNIAVFWPNWIGDAVMATPAVRALRKHFSGSRFVGVLEPSIAELLEGSGWLDSLLLNKRHGPRAQRWPAVAASLRRQQIDLAVLFPNSFRTALIAWLGNCRRRVGYARYGRSMLLTDALRPLRDPKGKLLPSPVIDAYNRLAQHVGCPAPSHRLELFTTLQDEEGAEDVWKQCQLAKYPEVVCLNGGGAFGTAKHWPPEYFAQLARSLAVERRCAILVLCGPAEKEAAREIAAQARVPGVFALADWPLCLGLTKACVRRADLLITTDSGPRHFAAAFDRPVVTLFGPTHIAWTETYYPKALHLQEQVDCGPCQRRVCPLDHRCMKVLLPGQVKLAAVALLERWSRRNAHSPLPITG